MVFSLTKTLIRPSAAAFSRRNNVLKTPLNISKRNFGAKPSGPRPKEYGGFLAPEISTVHKNTGEAMMVVMWLWIFYRMKKDWKVLFGLEHPFDHHGDH